MKKLTLVAALALAAAACSSPRTTGVADGPQPQAERRTARSSIDRAELERGTTQDLLTAVQTLRPSWLRGASDPRVYVGNAPVGEGNALREINPMTVERVDYLTPNQAIARFGADHRGGAIIVHMRT